MGLYLNSSAPFSEYMSTNKNPYFVDKSAIFSELIPLLGLNTRYVCITRPRRFGKTTMANMIAAYFSKGRSSEEIFSSLAISDSGYNAEHNNKHNVVFIDFSQNVSRVRNGISVPNTTYNEFIGYFKANLINELLAAYPNVHFNSFEVLEDIFKHITIETGEKFVFVLDEWDAPFRFDFMTEKDKDEYLFFLKTLLKDKEYVELAYMTGIMPISKYSGGSELNMFREYKMTRMGKFSTYFGFTETEVDVLFSKYQAICTDEQEVTREGLREWYNGYYTSKGVRLYNPLSIIASLSDNELSSYWTDSGAYDDVYYYIKNNVNGVRDDIAKMMVGESVDSATDEYSATYRNLDTRAEIFSAMVVYGLLTENGGSVMIPNKEVQGAFATTISKHSDMGVMNKLANESDRLLNAVRHSDTETISSIIAYAHDTESPNLFYNDETELSFIVTLAFLGVRNKYRIVREDKAGKGFADFLFYPVNPADECIIIELKSGDTAENALAQIKKKNYALAFAPKLGEERRYTGRVIAVGIGYDKKGKTHSCMVEELYASARHA